LRWFLLLFLPVLAEAQPTLNFTYGQSANVWGLVSDIKTAKKNLPRINEILNQNYNSYQTAFTRIGVEHYFLLRTGGWPNKLRLAFDLEGAALGMVQNPVVPELQASLLMAGILGSSVSGRIGESFYLEAGMVAGAGNERRLTAVSTDLIEKLPFRKEKLSLVGVDLEMRQLFRLGKGALRLLARTEETVFFGQERQVSVTLNRNLRKTYHQWQGRADYSRSAHSGHLIFGPHPLPTKFLPRIWNRAANTNPWRELGAMSGIGGATSFLLGGPQSLGITGGFYGGYPGGELRWKFGEESRLSLMTYGIENSSAYQTLGQRIYALQTLILF
jgi:hypothetical protein